MQDLDSIEQFAVLCITLMACGARTDLGGHETVSALDASAPDAALPSVNGAVVNDCAPNDAPAIAFPFALEGATVVPSCMNSVVSASSIRFSFWNPIVNAPGEFTVGNGSLASGSIASVCPSAGQCVAATHGTFTVTTFTETSASGFFMVVLPDQTMISRAFTDVPVCHNLALCG